jgi:membrane-bound lytic murein transglycosylase B
MRRTAALFFVAIAFAGCSDDTRDATTPTSAPTTTTGAVATTTTTAPRVVRTPADIEPPRSAAAAATRITQIERALRRASTPKNDIPRLGWEQDVIYQTLQRNEAWRERVLAAVPSGVARVVAANVGGNRSISSLVEPPTTLPTAWRIVAPPRAEELLRYYREAEAASDIPWQYLAAINLVETRMGRIVGDSTAGAQGPMQFIPSSWEAFGEGGDVRDHRDAILAAGRYLDAAGGPENMSAAIFAYNHSRSYVDAVTRYASLMAENERAYLGYHQWQVRYRTVDALYLLPEGYPQQRAVRTRLPTG